MTKKTVEAGARFGNLLVVGFAYVRHELRFFECKCDCGGTTFASVSGLRAGRRVSCGCKFGVVTHGHTRDRKHPPEYQAWTGLISRCESESDPRYPLYGGRGIKVCARWRESFEAFLADMGPRPSEKHSIDRYPNNDGNYEPGNCRWATHTEQMRNTRRSRFIEFNGERLPAPEWAQRMGLSADRILQRIDRQGWSVERALTTPVPMNQRR